MSKELSSFEPLESVENVWGATKSTLRCTAIQLKDGSICLYSPVLGLSDDALASLRKLGKVKYLLAPNHYHHKGLAQYQQAFPNAKLVCSHRARPRLEQQTGLVFGKYDAFEKELTPNVRLLEPEGLKTGEVWMDVAGDQGRAWIVTDAFKGAGKSKQTITDVLELLGTFPKFGIDNITIYLDWLTEHVSSLLNWCER